MVWAVSLLTTDLIARSLTPSLGVCVFRVSLSLVPGEGPQPNQCFTPQTKQLRLYLNIFRGEPAISEFDQPFTPTHGSSLPFSTDQGSALHLVLPKLQPDHRQITRIRVYHMKLHSPYSDSVSLRLRYFYNLTLLHMITRRLILQKARRHPITQAPTACRSMVSDSISLPFRGSFHRFLHSTRALSVAIPYLALEGGPPRFQQDFTCPAVLEIIYQ